jgi:hypothetical protein
MAQKYGYEGQMKKVDNQHDFDLLQKQIDGRIKVANIQESAANSRAVLTANAKSNKDIVTFKNGKDDDELDVDSAIAFAEAALNDKTAEYGDSYDLVKQKGDIDYQLLQKAAANGYSTGELKAIMSRLYPKLRDKYGIYSKVDQGRTAPEVVPPVDPLGVMEPLQPNQNPSRQPVEPKKTGKKATYQIIPW